MMQANLILLKRNKFQRWLIIASGFFLLVAVISFLSSGNTNNSSEMKQDYKNIALSELLQQANNNYEKGQFEQAIPYLEEAANKGSARAQYSLGYMYQNGEGVEKNIDKAKEYYKLSAKQGHKKAKAALKGLGK